MTVRLSALHAGRSLPPRNILVLISLRGRVDPRTIIRLEGLGSRRRLEDNIEMGWDSMDWILLAQDRDQWRALLNTLMNLQVP
jgi:hypothetical protein